MWLSRFLAGWQLGHATPGDHSIPDIKTSVQTSRLQPRGPAAALVESSNVATLHRTLVQPASSLALESHVVLNSPAVLQTVLGGAGYATNISIGDTEVLMSVDTGSSDTWLASADLQCIAPQGYQVPTAYCNFGPLFGGMFAGGIIPDQNFKVMYGSGEFVTGVLGYANLTIANVTIDRQEVALVKQAYWQGDHETTGLMGLGYRSLTSSYRGNDSSKDGVRANYIGYSPVVESALSQGLFSMFSMALQRSSEDNEVSGYLALGGLPPVQTNQSFVSTPILLTNLTQNGRSDNVYSFYAIRPDGFSISGGLLSGSGTRFWRKFTRSSFSVIIDSGTTLNYLPISIAARVSSLFNPPAVFNAYVGAFEVDCDAVTPDVSIRIAGVDFPINGEDLIIRTEGGYDYDTGKCITTIQPSGQNIYILGDAFLKNVVAVFDVGAAQMRFSSRPYY